MRMDDPVEEYLLGLLIIGVLILFLMMVAFAYQHINFGPTEILAGAVLVLTVTIAPFAVVEGIFKLNDWYDHFR